MRIPTPIAGAIAAASAAALVVTLVPASATVDTTTSAAPTAAASDQRAQGTIDSKVRGTFGQNGTVRGTFTPKRFIVKDGEVFADGVLHAVMRRGNGNVVGRPDREILIPVIGDTASDARGRPCEILHLVLGPLDLDLLGLQVHLNRVVLHIQADPGPGNLLGNLLCLIAGLLDDVDLSTVERLKLANFLNRVLGLL